MEYTTTLRAKLCGLALLPFLLNSCSDPASVGIELAPGNNQIGVFYQDFVLDAQLVMLDSFNTVNTNVLVVGNETDDYFGKTDATGYSRLYINASQTRPTTEAILDSMFFNLDVVSVNGSGLEQAKRFAVHRLTEPILDTAYYNFDKLAFEEVAIAEVEATFGDVKDSVLRFAVREEFQEELFGKMKLGTEFNNLVNFRDYLPGIALKAREGDNSTIGVATGANTGISVYFHYGTDTVSKSYTIVTSPARHFNGIVSDRSGTLTEVVTEYGKSYEVGPIVGMKSTVAMALRIDTSPLDAFLDTLSGVIFNQVNFSLGAIQSQDEDNSPISAMMMKFVDENNDPIRSTINNAELYVQADREAQVLLDSNGDKVPNYSAASAAVLTYDSEDKLYISPITSHVNAIYRGDIIRQNWLLYPVISTAGDDFKRSLRQFKVDKSKIKVQVIYSKTR